MRNRWFFAPDPPAAPEVTVVCLAHAGGGASAYVPWRARLPRSVGLLAVQLPGRETRMAEPLVDDLRLLARQLAPEVGTVSPDVPVVLFGHSMGALVALETAQVLVATTDVRLAHVVVAGCNPPHLPRRRLSALDDDDFLAAIVGLRGIPSEVLEEPALMRMVLPVLRTDIAMAERYSARTDAPLPCSITALGGCDDGPVTAETLAEWRFYTSGELRVRLFSGGHFFVRSSGAEVAREVASIARACLDPTG